MVVPITPSVSGLRGENPSEFWYNRRVMGYLSVEEEVKELRAELKEIKEKFRAAWKLVQEKGKDQKLVRVEAEPREVLIKLKRIYARLHVLERYGGRRIS